MPESPHRKSLSWYRVSGSLSLVMTLVLASTAVLVGEVACAISPRAQTIELFVLDSAAAETCIDSNTPQKWAVTANR